ncbi:MAG: hypothetical protein MJZ25_01340 [Fibrobacter sp.]|nr:hypothetical protein [Fibrobacter sp.]
MNKLKVLLLALSVFAATLFAQTPAADSAAVKPSVEKNPADYAFEHFYVSIEGGEIYPFGDLIDAVQNTLYGGVGIRYSYWENADGFMTFNYSYFKPVAKTKLNGVNQFSGKVGMDWKLKYIRPLIIGAGFTCNFTRAEVKEGKTLDFGNDLGGTLGDNETEFGWFVHLNIPFWNFEKYRVGMNAVWEELWTLPKRSEMLTVGLYIERRIW